MRELLALDRFSVEENQTHFTIHWINDTFHTVVVKKWRVKS